MQFFIFPGQGLVECRNIGICYPLLRLLALELAIDYGVLVLLTLYLAYQRPHPILKHRYSCNLIFKSLKFHNLLDCFAGVLAGSGQCHLVIALGSELLAATIRIQLLPWRHLPMRLHIQRWLLAIEHGRLLGVVDASNNRALVVLVGLLLEAINRNRLVEDQLPI